MSEIKVPEGMLRSAVIAFDHYPNGAVQLEDVGASQIESSLEAALRWLSENPIAPSEDELARISSLRVLYGSRLREHLIEWQRTMFLAPEPVDDLKSVLENTLRPIFPADEGWTPPPFRDSNQSVAEVDARIIDLLFSYPTHVTVQTAEDRIRRAYRRGHKEGSK